MLRQTAGMRAFARLALVASCAWSCARAIRAPAARVCDVLQIAGNASLMTFAADTAGGIALGGDSGGRLRAGPLVVDAPGGFILRTTAARDPAWVRPMSAARPLAVAIAPDGTTIVVGQTRRHCFASRLDVQGREAWTSALGGDGESACRAVAFDESSGDVWAAGEFTGALGPARSAGMTDLFVLRINGRSGEMRLVRALGGQGAERASSIAVNGEGEIVVAGTFGLDVDASLSQVNFGRGPARATEGADAFLLGLGSDGGTRWISLVGEHGDDEVVGLAARDNAVFAAANLHRARDGARCGGQAAVLRNHDWVQLEDDECVAVRALTVDDSGRIWTLENTGRAARARAFAPTDGSLLGMRSWDADRATVRGIGIARVPGGFAAAAVVDGELTACGKPVGNAGERTPFVVWVRDVTP
jgi:hypothetical protein